MGLQLREHCSSLLTALYRTDGSWLPQVEALAARALTVAANGVALCVVLEQRQDGGFADVGIGPPHTIPQLLREPISAAPLASWYGGLPHSHVG
jgi:hypothetical protein